MISQIDAIWWHKFNGLSRRAIAHGLLNAISNPVVLTEYPKSGGSWISQMLSVVLEMPYTRNRLPTLGDQILHGCFLNVNANIDTVVVWRDGRDTMVSYYYHMMFEKPVTSAKASKKLRLKLGIDEPRDIDKYLPRFIEWACVEGYPRFSWSDFVNTWYENDSAIFTSYESFLQNPINELRKIATAMGRLECDHADLQHIVDSYSFESQTSRKPGEEDYKSFIRKGIAGDWVNSFNLESREIFKHYCGPELQLLGYTSDDKWVQDCK